MKMHVCYHPTNKTSDAYMDFLRDTLPVDGRQPRKQQAGETFQIHHDSFSTFSLRHGHVLARRYVLLYSTVQWPDMAAKEQRRLDFERSQNIALLSLLTKNPAPVGANTCPPQIINQTKGRTLSFSRECHLAEAVAFISGISDNPDHVVAVCLEEIAKAAGLRVLVAINRSTHAHATDEKLLRRIKEGLDAVFRVLARTGTENAGPGLEEQVTDAIIDLCRDRILARIRSQKHGASSFKLKGRPSTSVNLKKILSAVCRHLFNKHVFPPSNVDSFSSHIEKLVTILDKIENSESRGVNVALKELLVVACALHRGRRAVNFGGMLENLNTSELDPSHAGWFRVWIRKLSRYRECAGYLFRTAKKTNLLKNVTVVTVSLDQEYFIRDQEPTANETCLTNCVSRCRNGAGADTLNARSRVAALKQLGNGAFLPALDKISAESRIHAEIQILAHYDIHPAKIPPRVVKSNKDACYLCNLFIRSHGKLFTPRTHGRLYNGWRPPNVSGLNDARRRMNGELQARIWERSLNYAETNAVQNLISVNESNTGSLSSMSSLGSFGLLTEGVIAGKPTLTAGIISIGEALSPEELEPSPKGKSSKKGKEKGGPTINKSTGQGPQAAGLSHIFPYLQHSPDRSGGSSIESNTQEEGSPSSSQSSSESQRQSQDTTDREREGGPSTIPQTSLDLDLDPDSDIEADTESSNPSETSEDESQHQAQPEPGTPLDQDDEQGLGPEQALDLQHEPSTPPPSAEEVQAVSSASTSPSPKNQSDLSPPVSQSLPQTSDSNVPLEPGINIQPKQDFMEEGEDTQAGEIILTQGQPSTIVLTTSEDLTRRPRNIPTYRNGKNGSLTIHPEYLATKANSGAFSSTRQVVEMRITWLLPDQQSGTTNTTSASSKEGPRHTPNFEADSLPTLGELDTGNGECLQLIDRDGQVALVEVVRT